MAIDEASHARWAARLQAANETAEQDAVFALDAMVTRDGHLANFHRLRTRGHKDELNLIEALSDTVTRALIDPGAIAELVAPFATDPSLQMSTLFRRITTDDELSNPNVVKVVIDRSPIGRPLART